MKIFALGRHFLKQMNTPTLSSSDRRSHTFSEQAQYGNVVKWPTGIGDKISDYAEAGSPSDSAAL